MAEFEDIEITYDGVQPLAVLKLAYNLTTCSGLIVINYIEKDTITFTIHHFNTDNSEELRRKVGAIADLLDGKVTFNEPDAKLRFTYDFKTDIFKTKDGWTEWVSEDGIGIFENNDQIGYPIKIRLFGTEAFITEDEWIRMIDAMNVADWIRKSRIKEQDVRGV